VGVFISYRRDDSAGYAGRLHEELEQRLGADKVFRDVDTLQAGQDFVDTINLKLQECGALVALIGRDWLTARTASGALRLEQADDFVALEIETGLKRPDVVVIPVLVGGASMPAPAQLPPKIRALSRRHAIWLRDETWETDVDRLTAAINRSARWKPFGIPRAAVLAAGLAIAGIATFLVARGAREPEARQPAQAIAAPAAFPSGISNVSSAASAIDVPPYAEAAHGELIYTLLSANVASRGTANHVRFRFRVSNEGRYDANLWDASFRLALGDDVLTPTSGLNEILAGHSIKQAIVTFSVPAGTSRATLRILGGNDAAEIPLDLTPGGRAAEDEKADAGDALSRARLASLVSEPRPLIATEGFSATLLRATSRLFVNKRRLIMAVRMTNQGRYPMASGDLRLRLQAGDEVIPPAGAPNAVIDAGASLPGDFVFETPPGLKTIELRAAVRNESATLPLEVR
jgi:hypothetical protein